MRSRFMLLGAAVGLLLSGSAVAGAVLGWWWLVVGSAMVLGTAAWLVTLDANRRVRQLRKQLGRGIQASETEDLTNEELVGLVRVLQAQYVGRFDQVQARMDEAVRVLKQSAAAGEGHSTGGH